MYRASADQTTTRITLPIADFTPGEICPPLEPEHASWVTAAGWDDPLASRGGYAVPACKTRETIAGEPALLWQSPKPNARDEDRSFIIGEPTWREYSLSCRMQPLQEDSPPTHDEPFNHQARAGLVFRMETVRRYYTFCVVNRQRLVLYRRNDSEWVELAGADIDPGEEPLTLTVTLEADSIRAACPELDITFAITDSTYPAGRGGYRTRGTSRLFALAITMTASQQAVNQRLADRLRSQTDTLSANVPDAISVGTLDLRGRTLVACCDFCRPDRNDLLFLSAEGMTAETWDGEQLWHLPEPLGHIVFSAEHQKHGRILYALAGQRRAGQGSGLSVVGVPMHNVVQDELVTVAGTTGTVLGRVKLPTSPREDLLRHYDLSYETGRITSPDRTDILVREWRQDWGGGGEMLWAFDSELNPLWEQKVHPGYGHHNALHFVPRSDSSRDVILAGGTLLSSQGELLWRHDQADPFFETVGGQHYDAAVMGSYSQDPEIDPCVFLMGGSAGVYVVDGQTGHTRSHHRIGHAQWGMPCRVRSDLPGQQILVGTRWGSYGIMTLFSGRGDRLWSIQPDYVLQGTTPVEWVPDQPQYIWCCRSLMAMGLYDGHGRMVNRLEPIRKLYADGTKKPTRVLRRTPGGPDLLGLQLGDTLHLFGADS